MNPVPVGKMAYLLVLLLIAIPASSSFAMNGDETFFSNLDSTIQGQLESASNKKDLIVDRYLRLLARLDIFGLYCDDGNRMGYSTRVSALQRKSTRLEKWTKEIYGGKGAYNRFEQYRSQESLRYVRSDRARTCELSKVQFHALTDLPPKDFLAYLSSPPFGSL